MGGFKRETPWLTGCGNPIQEGLGPPNLFGVGLATPVALVVLEYPAEGNHRVAQRSWCPTSGGAVGLVPTGLNTSLINACGSTDRRTRLRGDYCDLRSHFGSSHFGSSHFGSRTGSSFHAGRGQCRARRECALPFLFVGRLCRSTH